MRKFLLSLALWLGLLAPAAAQCVAVGGINSVPQTGMTCDSEPSVTSYAATSVALVPVAAGATDYMCLAGSASRVVRLQSVRAAGTATTIVSVPFLIMKHTSLNTGTASATGTQIPVPYALDPNNAAATATTRAWITANPTITDAAPGIIASGNLQLNLPAAVSGNMLFDWRTRNYSQAPILRSASQEICFNLNTTAVTAGLLYTSVEWTESPQ